MFWEVRFQLHGTVLHPQEPKYNEPHNFSRQPMPYLIKIRYVL